MSFPSALSTIRHRKCIYYACLSSKLCFRCSFSALSSHFKDLHLFSFDDEELLTSNDRLTPTAKRIAEGWIAYSLVEIKQRYNIPGKVH